MWTDCESLIQSGDDDQSQLILHCLDNLPSNISLLQSNIWAFLNGH